MVFIGPAAETLKNACLNGMSMLDRVENVRVIIDDRNAM